MHWQPNSSFFLTTHFDSGRAIVSTHCGTGHELVVGAEPQVEDQCIGRENENIKDLLK